MGRFTGGIVNYTAGNRPGSGAGRSVFEPRIAEDLGNSSARVHRKANSGAMRNSAAAGVDRHG